MFGFQRIGDLIWAAADQRSRGFLLGATAGRTTLGGEGLQHQDGSSLLQAAAVPNCRAYDPCFAGEFAVILDHGMRQMLEEQEDVFYYVTLMNENYAQPSLPAGVEEDILRGMYLFAEHAPRGARAHVRLMGSGTILREVIAAAEMLATDWGVSAEVWSATSFSELARDARETERWNRLHPAETLRHSHVERCLAGDAPVIAASDYVRAWPQLATSYLTAPVTVLGTDGFGRSDTRAALRSFFEVDRHHVVLAALTALRGQGLVDAALCVEAIARYGISTDQPASWSC
jgi:pyruvate dehydrogenase E1 component